MGNRLQVLKIAIAILAIVGLLIVQVSALSANARIVPAHGTAPLNVMFTDISEGNPIEWHWDFGDGYSGDGPRTMHTYMSPGTYSVTLLALDAQGAADTKSFNQAIMVNANPFMPMMPMPVPSFSADFTGGPQSGSTPLTVSFADLSKGEPVTWVWNFGDGSSSIDQSPVHVYTNPGTYTVTLKITKDTSTGMKERKNYITATQGTNTVEQSYSPVISPTPTEALSAQDYPTADPGSSESAFVTNAITDDVDICDLGLSLTTESETIQYGNNFTVVVKGTPLEKVYLWISSNSGSEIKGQMFPIIADNGIVFDQSEGPFSIGLLIPDETTGQSILDLIPDNQSAYATSYYGMVTLDKNGEHLMAINARDASPAEYTMNAISGDANIQNGCIEKMEITILS